jgi:hypothetical protein
VFSKGTPAGVDVDATHPLTAETEKTTEGCDLCPRDSPFAGAGKMTKTTCSRYCTLHVPDASRAAATVQCGGVPESLRHDVLEGVMRLSGRYLARAVSLPAPVGRSGSRVYSRYAITGFALMITDRFHLPEK